MREFRADLHIHSVLSPCGAFEMSPARIVNTAAQLGIDIIGLADHNTTRHGTLVRKLARQKGILVLQGAEVTTREEVHCLVFFEDQYIRVLQKFLDENLPDIDNDPTLFGYQVQVDENENIIYEEVRSLYGALQKTISEVQAFVHSYGGIFIPAHVDRRKNSIYSQLGFLPSDLQVDALEVSYRQTVKSFREIHPELSNYRIITSSDAHFPDDIGKCTTTLCMEDLNFREVRMSLAQINGRKICGS